MTFTSFGPSPSDLTQQPEMCEEHRLTKFSNSADLAVALLASATCGISGLPFKFQDEDGKEQEVADGALALLENVFYFFNEIWGVSFHPLKNVVCFASHWITRNPSLVFRQVPSRISYHRSISNQSLWNRSVMALMYFPLRDSAQMWDRLNMHLGWWNLRRWVWMTSRLDDVVLDDVVFS